MIGLDKIFLLPLVKKTFISLKKLIRKTSFAWFNPRTFECGRLS
jgi:hypothetical protein